MKPSELKKWMKDHNKNVVDVAAKIHVSPITIERFLMGKTKPIQLIDQALTKLVYGNQPPVGTE